MSGATLARRTRIEVFFDGVDISDDINKHLISLTYTDNEEDAADDLQIKLEDRDEVWLLKWLNDAIGAASEESQTESTGDAYKVIAKSGLNVRKGPGTSYGKYGTLTYGTIVDVAGMSNGWAAIDYNGQTAYVSGSYIEPSNESVVVTSSKLKISALIIKENWAGDGKDSVLNTGECELDELVPSGPPSTINIKATSLPYSSSIRQTKKSKAWENYTLRGIAEELAKTAGMACIYESAYNPHYKRVEQLDESDIAFQKRLCKNAGISLKATNKALVLFDQADYESSGAVLTLERGAGGYSKYKLRSGSADKKYGSCTVSYTDPDTGKTITATYADPEAEDNAQELKITAKITSIAEGQIVAKKALRQKNKYERTAEFTLPGNPVAVAGVTVILKRWGAFDGKYIVKTAKHDVSKSGGYETKINLRRVLEGY